MNALALAFPPIILLSEKRNIKLKLYFLTLIIQCVLIFLLFQPIVLAILGMWICSLSMMFLGVIRFEASLGGELTYVEKCAISLIGHLSLNRMALIILEQYGHYNIGARVIYFSSSLICAFLYVSFYNLSILTAIDVSENKSSIGKRSYTEKTFADYAFIAVPIVILTFLL